MNEEKYYEFVDLYKNPDHKGKLKDFDFKAEEYSSSCGDVFTVYLKMENGKVKDATFEGNGCIISTVSISKTCGDIVGKTPEEIKKMSLGEIKKIVGVDEISLSRIKCATIGLDTIKEALRNDLSK